MEAHLRIWEQTLVLKVTVLWSLQKVRNEAMDLTIIF